MGDDIVTIKRWEHYTSPEIFEKFKELHEYAMSCLEHAKETGGRQKDESNTGWEMIMDLLGKDIWETYNNYLE